MWHTRAVVRGVAAVAAAVAAAFSLTSSGQSAKQPVELGVLGNPARFAAITGQQSTARLLIAGWGARNFAQLFSMMGDHPMLGINAGTVISPAAIARGQDDDYLQALNAGIAEFGKPVYIRPLAEMNGHWNGYSAYDSSGRQRGPTHTTAMFKKAFARIYLAVHGGPDVNATLHTLGLPPFKGDLASNQLASVIWNPQGFGSPDLPGNSAQSYYPGDRYVDVVGDDLYFINGKAEWKAAEALYKAHPSKPFSFPEWGLWGLDDAGFVRAMATFVRTHPRTALISYYNGKPGSIFDLASKPQARAAYRRLILPLAARG